MLAQNVVMQSDGGGKVLAFLNPIVGLERVLRLYAGLHRKLTPGRRFSWPDLDRRPARLSQPRARQRSADHGPRIEDGRITAIYITRNPDKLRHIAEAAGEDGMHQAIH